MTRRPPADFDGSCPDEAEKLEQELQNAGLPARIVGTITEPGEVEILYEDRRKQK